MVLNSSWRRRRDNPFVIRFARISWQRSRSPQPPPEREGNVRAVRAVGEARERPAPRRDDAALESERSLQRLAHEHRLLQSRRVAPLVPYHPLVIRFARERVLELIAAALAAFFLITG